MRKQFSDFTNEFCKFNYERTGKVLLILLSLGLLAWHSSHLKDWIVDDAAISYSYSLNLVNHGDLTLTPGGERTEGFSNPLLVFLIAVLMKIQIFSPFWASRVLGFGFCIFSFIYLARIIENIAENLRSFGWGLGLLLATSSSYVIWTFAGLENPLYVLLILMLVERLVSFFNHPFEQKPQTFWVWTGFLLFLIALTRPEGLLYGIVTMAFVFLFVGLWPKNPLKGQWTVLLSLCLAFLVPLSLFFIWRWSYFHDFLANPYYAKMYRFYQGESPLSHWQAGWLYLKDGVKAQSWHLLGFVAILGLVKIRDPRVFVLYALGLTAGFFPLYSGGDWMMEFRFLTPLLPLILAGCLLGFDAAISFFPHHKRKGKLLVLLLLIGFLIPSGVTGFGRTIDHMKSPTLGMANVEGTAKSFKTWGEGVGLNTVKLLLPDVGGSGYWGSQNNLEIVDLGGLGDRLIARNGLGPQLWKYLFENHRPDFMTFHQGWALKLQAQNYPDFYHLYHPIWEKREKWFPAKMPKIKAGAYVRRDLVAVDIEQINKRIDGPQVDGFVLNGVSGETQSPGKNRLTVYMQCVRKSPIPRIGWLGQNDHESGHDIPMKLLAGGCYKEGFVRIGDIVPTSFILDDNDIGKGIILYFKGKDSPNAPLQVALGALEWQKKATIEEMIDWGHGYLAENRLDDCLEVVQKARQTEEGMGSRELRELGQELSALYYQLAESEELAADSLVGIGQSWDLYWKACEAWRGNSEALQKCADLWRYNMLAAGGVGAEAAMERAVLDEPAPVIRYQEIMQRAVAPIFPLDKLRLGGQVHNLDYSNLPDIEMGKTFLTGWGGKEHWGRWALETQSNLLVDVPGADTGENFYLVLRVASWQDDRSPQRIKVAFEGEEVGEITLDGPPWQMKSYSFKLPTWQGKAVITFSVEELVPDQQGSRTLRAFPLESCEVVAFPKSVSATIGATWQNAARFINYLVRGVWESIWVPVVDTPGNHDPIPGAVCALRARCRAECRG